MPMERHLSHFKKLTRGSLGRDDRGWGKLKVIAIQTGISVSQLVNMLACLEDWSL
jgi:hypothetical protein